MAHRARIIGVGIAWWVLSVVALCACLQFVWIAAARLGLVQIRQSSVAPGYSGGWADVIGFSALVALPLGIIGISIAVITLRDAGSSPARGIFADKGASPLKDRKRQYNQPLEWTGPAERSF